MNDRRRLLVVEVAALGAELVERHADRAAARGLSFRRAETVFPALTCPVQASFRTGAPPAAHGVLGNGLYARRLARSFFWEQSAALVAGPRWWDAFRAGGGSVGLMFWQQSLGEAADLLLSPRPIHKHHGGLVQDCHSRPDDLYARLSAQLGRPFPLAHYWGPLASHRSSGWIVDAACAVMTAPGLAPDLLLTYLPHLDYDLQRHGPAGVPAVQALDKTFDYLSKLWTAATAAGYDCLFFGDYAMAPVTRPAVFPNRRLRACGLLKTRSVRGRHYPDFFASEAVVLADHEVALVHARTPDVRPRVRAACAGIPGVAAIVDLAPAGDGPDFLLVADEGAWFAYPWWEDAREAPDYAAHIDIHHKPGYDPCELFWGFPPPRVSTDPSRVRGTHGRAGPGRAIAWTASWNPEPAPANLPDLARATSARLEQRP